MLPIVQTVQFSDIKTILMNFMHHFANHVVFVMYFKMFAIVLSFVYLGAYGNTHKTI